MATTPRLQLPLLEEAQASPEILVNLGRYEVDAILQGAVIRRDLTSPPVSPNEGDAYIVDGPSSGAWAGEEDAVAAFQGGGWRFYTPREGWRLWVVQEAVYVRFGLGSPSTWSVDAGTGLTVGTPGSPATTVPEVATLYFDNATVSDLGGGAVLVTPGSSPGSQPIEIQVALSDMTTALTTGASKAYIRAPCGFTLTSVRASLFTASSTGGPVTVDVNVAGATILSTKLTIDDTEKTSTTAATPAVISSATIADDAEITFDIDDEGTGAAGLIVTLIGTR